MKDLHTHDQYYNPNRWKEPLGSDPKKYKSYVFFENIAKTAELPQGYFVQLGVGQGYTLQRMKEYWGQHRVIGIDLHNTNNDASVFCVDIKKLCLKFPCSYIENDIGSSISEYGKKDRWAATQWAIDCLISGGLLVTSADHKIGFPVKQYAQDNNCSVSEMSDRNHESWAKFLNSTDWKTEGWYIIKKNQ